MVPFFCLICSAHENLRTIQFTDNKDKILISPKCFGSIGHQGPEMPSIQILDVGENSFLADKDTSDSKSLWRWAKWQCTGES